MKKDVERIFCILCYLILVVHDLADFASFHFQKLINNNMHSYLYSFDAVSSGLCLVAVTPHILVSLPYLRLAQICLRELLLETKDNIQTHIILGSQGGFLSGPIICLYFVFKIVKTTNVSTKKHNILKQSLLVLRKTSIFAYIL